MSMNPFYLYRSARQRDLVEKRGESMEKLTDFITVRVPPVLKNDYDKLDAIAKKKAKDAILHALGKVCFAELHYDPTMYFGEGTQVEDGE